MVQGRERLCFAGEPGQPIGVAGEGVREDFERDVTIQFRAPSWTFPELPRPNPSREPRLTNVVDTSLPDRATVAKRAA